MLMDLTTLPEEVADHIFTFLPVKDLLSCSGVNSSWRNGVNHNFIWKRQCNPNYLNLQHLNCIVKPSCQVPICNSGNLTDLCHYRIKYMQEIHLKNNFKGNRYECSMIPYEKFHQSPVCEAEFFNNYLVLNDYCQFYIWDIHKETPNQIQSVPFLLQKYYVETIQFVGDSLVVVQSTLLQVYNFVDGKFSLKMCRVFDRDEVYSHKIPVCNDLTDWYLNHIGAGNKSPLHSIAETPLHFKMSNLIEDKYFIGIIKHDRVNEASMHIWDLGTGRKLKKDTIPQVTEIVENICCGSISKYIYIGLYLSGDSGVRCKIFSYDLKELQFTNFYVESYHLNPAMVTKEKVVLSEVDWWKISESYIFMGSITGEKIFEKTFHSSIYSNSVDVYKSTLAYGSNGIITVVDLTTQEELMVQRVDPFYITKVCLLDFNFFIVEGVLPGNGKHIGEVWDMDKCSQQSRWSQKKYITSRDRRLTRLIFKGGANIIIKNFW